MKSVTNNKAIMNWEDKAKLKTQLHMAVRVADNVDDMAEALEVLKKESKEKKNLHKSELK